MYLKHLQQVNGNSQPQFMIVFIISVDIKENFADIQASEFL